MIVNISVVSRSSEPILVAIYGNGAGMVRELSEAIFRAQEVSSTQHLLRTLIIPIIITS